MLLLLMMMMMKAHLSGQSLPHYCVEPAVVLDIVLHHLHEIDQRAAAAFQMLTTMEEV